MLLKSITKSMDASFISCDWGTSSFRLRHVNGQDLSTQQELCTNRGIKDIFASLPTHSQSDRERAYTSYLGTAADQLLEQSPGAKGLPILLSGMASSTIGWRELPYAGLPFKLSGENIGHEIIPLRTPKDRHLQTILFSGVASETEIMRGEECELIGIASMPDYAAHLNNCVIILPGTHSKHVRVKNNQINEFHTSMTGELFETIAHHTILSSSIAKESDDEIPLESQAKTAALTEGVATARKLGFMRSLFQVRTRSVLHSKSPLENREFLSGLLIAAELLALDEAHSTEPILLAAGHQFGQSYKTASSILNLDDRVICLPPEEVNRAAIRGHAALRKLEPFSN